MKIAVYTITKNEEQFIERWAKSCEEADYRLIVDTGSTDNTVKIAKENGCEVGSISIKPWRFDDARNAAMAMLPDDVDWCVSLDADEVLQPGWRQYLEALPETVTRPRYKYVWSWNHDGSEGLVFYRDHIHRRNNYRWKHPVHEILVCTDIEVQQVCDVEVHHHPDPTKSRSQYLPLLELAVKEDPEGDRNMFYLGREYMFNGMYKEAKPHFLKHLEISQWDAERSASMRYLARVTGDREHWLLRACAEASSRREPWVELAQLYYEQGQWVQCYAAAQRALSIAVKPLDYICEPDAWGAKPHDLTSIALWNMGMKEQSLGFAKIAQHIEPFDGRLRSNVGLILRGLRKTDVDVIIPTKSNTKGLENICNIVLADPSVKDVYVVADGEKALENIKKMDLPGIKLLSVPEGSGIHVMWNAALDRVSNDRHVCFINDDVHVDTTALSTMAAQLDDDQNIGLICPNYDNRLIEGLTQDVRGANGTYGKTGISGATMMLRSNLVHKWRFDERMRWYFGDDDIALWTLLTEGKRTVVSSLARSWGNESWTTQNDPPKDFDKITANDKVIFDEKWGNHASGGS